MPATNVYYDVAMKRLDAQIQQVDQLDAKAATLFASASGVLAIFAGLLSLAALPADEPLRVLVFVTLGLACVMYGVLLYCLFRAYRLGQWHFRPYMEDLQTNCQQYGEEGMQEWVADECLQSLKDNTALIVGKARYLQAAMIAFPIEAALLVVTGAITLLAK